MSQHLSMSQHLPWPRYVVEFYGLILRPKDLQILSEIFIWHFKTAQPALEIVEPGKFRVSVLDGSISRPIEEWLDDQKRFFDGLTLLGLIEDWQIIKQPTTEKDTTA